MDTGETGHVGDLIEDAPIHRTENRRAGVDASRDQHARFFRGRNFPEVVVDLDDLHIGVQFHTSSRMLKKASNVVLGHSIPSTYAEYASGPSRPAA